MLEREGTFNVIASTGSFSQICTISLEQSIDILLIDAKLFINIKELLNGHITNLNTHMKIIIMSTTGTEISAMAALNYGVSGYMSKNMNILTLCDPIQFVFEDKYYIYSSFVSELIDKYKDITSTEKVTPLPKPPPNLTKREYEILELFIDGKNNKDISKILSISEKTVKNHISSLFKRMNVSSRTQAAVKAIKNNWLPLHKNNDIKESNARHHDSNKHEEIIK